jgi:hypothetical protein
VPSTVSAVKDESELAGVAGDLTAEEAAALLEVTTDPALGRLLEACLEALEAE